MSLETLIVGGCALLAVSQVYGGLAFYGAMCEEEFDFKLPGNKLEGYWNLPKQFGVLDYLNISNSLIHPGEKHWVCRHFTSATYNAYGILVRVNKRNDLLKKINMAISHTGAGSFHAFLEYEDTELFQYEPMQFTPSLDVENVIEYGRNTKDDKMKTNCNGGKIFARSEPGGFTMYPNRNAFLHPGGFLRMIAERSLF